MRIVVVSDSHGRSDLLRKVMGEERNFAMLIHLGDGARDVQYALSALADRPLLQVRGNCDLVSDLPLSVLTEEGGKRILCAHGHTAYVKYGTQKYIEQAREAGADIALYGHTHVPVQEYIDGLYVCNPGALMQGSYAVLEIVPQGVMWLPKKLF